MSFHLANDTIVAQATPPGRGGVGIVRVSGPAARVVAERLLGHCPVARKAEYLPFKDLSGNLLDEGIALFFQGPHSFTGEDVLELQGHGGPILIDMIIKAILDFPDVRPARPGEFSERAFLNDKLDLTQAEAIADLIDTTSEQAAKAALQSLQGGFSHEIDQLVDQVIHLRMYVEAAIDFPEEEIDFLSDGKVSGDLEAIIDRLQQVMVQAKQGSLLREGMKVVIAGRPNAGKSSLLNALAGRESAIVTAIAGTTRDVLREHIQIDGMPLHIIDTAGLRESPDEVEQIGIARAWDEIRGADRVLFMVDATETNAVHPADIWPEFFAQLPDDLPYTVIRNKVDLNQEPVALEDIGGIPVLHLSAKTGHGVELLRQHLKHCVGYQATSEGSFMARRRHLDALERARDHLLIGQEQLELNLAGELLAEELRLTQQHLNEITGEFTSDDLLGKIFSSFCIGK
ncbi:MULTISPECIES: tRNA uridine-5-carboxymethylaminomethyl(34) synthesis GTPase MnmE [Idiomarina]|uniref:tRNA uridine-5-carboxymethylaminomethyl(34) synthesis GTPase MnmE n=1 Tax=Idiomarina TaxID=135575 RepID=UPI00129CF998|nr:MULTISPECIES: tRNA uridine-5-carboxymethylaminomethyl(34) synthesis GTPase MnmE [Idiomarina]MRJ42132.1 tRNA uridine-5-carboxymethylaminomethyl(34) synthesis GTPase MnmE [Idiomarina sp. FeN1]NCU57057.1 tRNA uridine-5-carboxymethylaminomethyl(34) synthesis GTPase MnmE [Idiomarina sp. FenA--70]NCU59766.1 tRNA uridine-5-carboxymethylaminomethyl(34) synthesis GTPase MnmE [Idiomarina sp. FenBw--71]UUN13242.1 tRNA uridine-5-carboxymethylaminomethyl(34) synthesis GTPase MnmE [Idiomarina loihiensis]